MLNQTIRDMLTMRTAKLEQNWFKARTDDRVRFYFENTRTESRTPGTIYQYDSSAAFILCALVEKLSGQEFSLYMREKLFDEIGVSKDAYCLKCPGGHSWGDSGYICTAYDLLLIARFILNKGYWNGRQILNKEFIRSMTSKLTDNDNFGCNDYNTQGYGYFTWMFYDNGFYFNGMGCQFALCMPDLDLIFIYNGDNQGKPTAKKVILDGFYRIICKSASLNPIAENTASYKSLTEYADSLELAVSHGKASSLFEAQINGVPYSVAENPMGISDFMLNFDGNIGELSYTNAQGKKSLKFGMNHNEISLFPQSGYSDSIGGIPCCGNQYRCAASASWIEERKLDIKVQIIDKYFGNLNIIIGFKDDKAGIFMHKCAEDFLDEYQGYAAAVQIQGGN